MDRELNNSNQFLKELEQFAESQKKLLDAEVGGFKSNDLARSQRVDRAHTDFRFFCRTYFPHYVKATESVFHEYIYDNVVGWIDGPDSHKEADAAPRGEAKSTIFTQLLTIWCIVTGRKHLAVIVMDSFDQASMMLEAIKVELEFNARLLQDYPKATGQGAIWQVGKAVTGNNRMLVAAGSGKKLRGLRHGPYRPDLVILDDIENDENVKSKDQRDKLEAWLNKSILKLKGASQKMDVFYIGTVLHYDSVLNRTLKHPRWNSRRFKAIITMPDRMDLWDKWEEILINESEEAADAFYNKRKTKMERGAVVSWPGARPLYALMKERSDGHAAFDSELQNDPTDSENAIFKDLSFWVQSSNWVFYGACDPSLGKKNKHNDPAAVLVGGWDKTNNRLDVVEADIARRVPNLIIQRVIDYQSEYKCILWAFESVQFQEFCRQVLLERSVAQRVPVPARGIVPNTDKVLRIESIEPFVTAGLIRLHQSQKVLVEQMRHFPQADHDDGPDALEMLWSLASRNAGGKANILSRGRPTEYRGYD